MKFLPQQKRPIILTFSLIVVAALILLTLGNLPASARVTERVSPCSTPGATNTLLFFPGTPTFTPAPTTTPCVPQTPTVTGTLPPGSNTLSFGTSFGSAQWPFLNTSIFKLTSQTSYPLTNGSQTFPTLDMAWSPNGQWLVYSNSDNNVFASHIGPSSQDPNILVASNPTPLSGVTSVRGLSWSPDGKRLVVSAGNDLRIVDLQAPYQNSSTSLQVQSIYSLMAINNPVPIFSDAFFPIITASYAAQNLVRPRWSPDGHHIAYVSAFFYPLNVQLINEVWVVDIDVPRPGTPTSTAIPSPSLVASNIRVLTHVTDLSSSLDFTGNFEPSWSPDSQWLAYSNRVSGDDVCFDGVCPPHSWSRFDNIYAVRIDGLGVPQKLSTIATTDYTDLNATQGLSYGPAWSPDGSRIAFVRNYTPFSASDSLSYTHTELYMMPVVIDNPNRSVQLVGTPYPLQHNTYRSENIQWIPPITGVSITGTPTSSTTPTLTPTRTSSSTVTLTVTTTRTPSVTFTPSRSYTPSQRPSSTLTQTPTKPVTQVPTPSPTSTFANGTCLANIPYQKDIALFRAPIEGNPKEEQMTFGISGNPNATALFDSFAIDPLTNSLWLHIQRLAPNWIGWVRVISPTGTGQLNVTALAKTVTVPKERTKPQGIQRPIEVPSGELERCINGNLLRNNILYTLPALDSEVPWNVFLPFSWAPISAGAACEHLNILGLGYPSFNASQTPVYKHPENYHMGVDLFARDNRVTGSSVYSIGNNGLIVGIGIKHEDDTSSGSRWGASTIEDGIGHNIIIRYGHFYVVYGHIREIDPSIYVGKEVLAGTRLGSIGTFEGSDPHLHMEIRSFGTNIPADYLVQTPEGFSNKYGILRLGSPSIGNVYDLIQFFSSNVSTFAQDYDSGTSVTISVRGMGPNIEDYYIVGNNGNSHVIWGSNCTLNYYMKQKTKNITVGVPPNTITYRGFILGKETLQTPSDPTLITNQPSNYP